jgi:uncharacterized membrane protein YiaA
MMSYSDKGLWVVVLVTAAFGFMLHRRSFKSTWKEITGPDWFTAVISYLFLAAAAFLFFAFLDPGKYGPIYPHSHWRPIALVASICLFGACLVVRFKYVGAASMRRLHRRRSRAATGLSSGTNHQG